MAAELTPSDDSGPIASINVTPFVDVALVLLVIFMITAPTLMKDVIGVQLPKAASSDAKAPASLGIAVTSQGQVLLNGKLVDLDALAAEARRAVAADPLIQAIISADAAAKHGDVVRVIDTIKTSGLNKFAFQIQRE